MKREFKFRAWDKNVKTMFDVFSFCKDYVKVVVPNVGDGVLKFPIAGFELMQYTGLKDKNLVDIYEGDVLRGIQKKQTDKEGVSAFPLTSTIDFRPGGFLVFGKPLQNAYTRDNNVLNQFMWCDAKHHATPEIYWQIDEIEIIGNIYQHPNFLS
jgi:uncharacterized phage protein (TIGR01671 family)